jgi:hypothetical protein
MQKRRSDAPQGRFSIRQSGNIGLEIISTRGTVVAWTTDEIVAQVIVNHLNRIIGQTPRLNELLDGEPADA